jgi:hypothetical protein
MDTISTYVTFVVEYAAALPRIVAWYALLGAFIIWVSGRRDSVFAWASFVLGVAALAIGGLLAKAYDPIAWGTLLGGVFVGAGVGWTRRWVWHLGWALSVCVLAAVFAHHIHKLPSGDAEALILIAIAGVYLGCWMPRLIQGEARSA